MLIFATSNFWASSIFFSLSFHSSFQEKNYQPIPPGTLNMFYTLWTPTEFARLKLFVLRLEEPDGAVISFPKIIKM